MEEQVRKRVPVCCLDTQDSVDVWPVGVSIQGESVHRVSHELPRGVLYLCAKTIRRDQLIMVVILQDIADRIQGLQVLVLRRVLAVQRMRVLDWTVRASEIDGDLQRYLAAAENVLDKVDDGFGVPLHTIDLRAIGGELLAFESCGDRRGDRADELMIAVIARLHEVNTEWLLFIAIAQHARIQSCLAPILNTFYLRLCFGLEDRLPLFA